MARGTREERKALRQSFDRRTLDRAIGTAASHYDHGVLTPEGRRLEAERRAKIRNANLKDDLRRGAWLLGTLGVAAALALLAGDSGFGDLALGLALVMAVVAIWASVAAYARAGKQVRDEDERHRALMDAAQRWSLLTEDQQRVLRRSASVRNSLATGGSRAFGLFGFGSDVNDIFGD